MSFFLLAVDQCMHTAQLVNDTIELLHETPFPSKKRYALSDRGLAACVDHENKQIHYGFIQPDGRMTGYNVVPFPDVIRPLCVVIVDQFLVLGGDCNSIGEYSDYSSTQYTEVIATYSVVEKEFKILEMPYRKWGKGIDDLLVDGTTVIAVDNIISPKYVLDYDFANPASPVLITDHDLEVVGPNEQIQKATMNHNLVAMHSTMWVQTGLYQAIAIYNKGQYDQHFVLQEFLGQEPPAYDPLFDWDANDLDTESMEYLLNQRKPSNVTHWRDILLDPLSNTLYIAAMERGIGIISIKEGDIPSDLWDESDEELEEISEIDDSSKVRYFQPVGWNVRKLLLVGEKIVLVGEKAGEWAVLSDEVRFAQ